jgi:O-antigen ligase
MLLFRYLLLFLVLCNIPNFVHESFRGASLGTTFYYFTYSLLLVYYFLSKKNNLAWPFLIFALTYFIISGLIFVFDETIYYNDFIKYIIIIICGGELARTTNIKELYIMLLVGAGSILVHALFFVANDARYSGFYIDPNSAGFLCLLGCALSYSFSIEKIKLLGFFFFTFCGILTFSRTFILLWIIILIIATINDKKNIKVFVIGLGSLLLIMSTAVIFQFNTIRFSFLTHLFEGNVDSNVISRDSRTTIWALYYDKIMENPIFGNGYRTFTGIRGVRAGVHNTYLRIIGESGIIPFLIYTAIYFFLLIKSIKYFKIEGYLFLLVLSIMALLMTNHNFLINNHITIISLWIYFKITTNNIEENEISFQAT